DMPFICDKFYRGKNAGNEQGSGLGLYIVKYLTEKMGGKMNLKNISDGFLVTISFLRTS
ncbi:MAG: sensor histidine kinase, partial [Lachnospiraceae bacterium]|nr:sensor histidine kinase [Lachnospiraceae bacterium]